MTKNTRGIIIGAGIGGLCSAIAMKHKGIHARVYEAADQLTPVGAGILVPPNAMAVLAQYNLASRVESSGHCITRLGIATHKGARISTSQATHVCAGTRYSTVAIHRSVLQQILCDALGTNDIHLGYRCKELRNTMDGVGVEFENGAYAEAEFVVGADGVRSKVRQSIFPRSRLRDSGQVCWRGIADVDLKGEQFSRLTELWGCGSRFGFVQIAPKKVYWYATIHRKHYARSGAATLLETLLTLYAGYVDPVKDIILSTQEQGFIEDDIYDLKPLARWFDTSVVLVGDAAHASTPNLGQGGAQAIEDAYSLAEQLAKDAALPQVFEMFQASRKSKVDKIVAASWRIGQVTSVSNAWMCSVRNAVLKGLAPMMSKKQSHMLYQWP